LRGGIGVQPATQAKVEQAALALRYRPSGVARSLKLRSTRTLGLIVTDIENPYFPQLIRSVEDAARARGFSVILADGRGDQGREIQSLEVLAERQVDGLLIASAALTKRHRDWIDERPCPVVIMNSGSAFGSVPAVLSDNVAGGRLAAEHLLKLNHRHLAYVATPASANLAVDERLAGVSAAVAAAGQPPHMLGTVNGDGGVEGGELAVRRALKRHPQTTALICYNDLTAVGALRGLHAAGLRVPGDVSVMGFDDIELAPYVDPPLSTIRQDTAQMGAWAVSTLLGLVARGASVVAEGAEAPTQRIPVTIVVRSSTGPAPA
jgi:DNA-binding LacI/PurR family transcriptional regulator